MTELLKQRLADAGVSFRDIRADLPHNAQGNPNITRPMWAVTRIANHYDGVQCEDVYDEVARIKSEAQYHIQKVWGYDDAGNPLYGDSLQYHMVIGRSGMLYLTRDLENMLWHVGGPPNYSSLALVMHGGPGQMCNREMAETYQKTMDVLTKKCPEFPATNRTTYGHKEFAQFGGTATACPGDFLPMIQDYRNKGAINLDNYPSAKAQPAPAPTPPPAPAPAPTPAPTPPPAPAPAPAPVVQVDTIQQAPPPPPVRRVRIKGDMMNGKYIYDGLSVRNAPGLKSVIVGRAYIGLSEDGPRGYGREMDVHTDQKVDQDGYTWIKRTKDGYFVAESAVEYI